MFTGSARFILILLSVVIILTLPSYATQYLNRVLITCEPLQYEIRPIEIYGGSLSLDRYYHNDYSDCTGESPGPPFLIELPIIIDNVYNDDATVAQGCSFIVDNKFGGGDPFEIYITDAASLMVNGEILAEGKAGDPVIFKNAGGFYNSFGGGPSNQSPYEYTFEFTWCEFVAIAYLSSPTLHMRGGHLLMNDCVFGATDDQHCLYYPALRNGVWDITFNDCTFGGVSHPTTSPIWLVGIRSLDLNNATFNGCDYVTSSPSSGVLEVGGNFILKNLNGISGSGNSRNWVYLNAATMYIEDSCTIKTSNNFTAFIADYVLVDTNATLVCDKGTVLQMNSEPESKIIVRGKMVMDSTVITSFADRAHGVSVLGWSTDDPNQGLSWKGIDVEIGGDLEIRNNSLIRWADGPIVGEGHVTLDHSTIEQGWGTAIDMGYTSPCRLELNGANIHQMYGLGEGVDFTMSIDNSDSASGYLVVDSTQITQCGGDGIYIGGGIGRALEDSLSVHITNSNISGNGGSGIYGYMGQPADSVIIMNNRFVGNGGNGLWLEDGGCDSMCVRLENNVALGNNGAGLCIRTGFADVIGNTSAYNEGYGLYYPYKPRRLGHVANNIFAYNDSYGLYCYAKYGGTVPGISHNVFWQNRDADNELYINSDDFLIYTVPELQALGGVGTTNAEFVPAFKPVYKDRILVRYYDSTLDQSRMWVDGDNLSAGELEGLAILPSHNDTTAWYYVVRNTDDSIFVAGDIRPTTNPYDTLTVFNFHLTSQSEAVDFGDTAFVTIEYDIDGDRRIIDSDDNGTELVDAGADEFNPDSTNLRILVFAPAADTTLVPGEHIILSWFAPAVTLVNIDYTIDIPLGEEPTEWLEVAHNVPGSVPAYDWEIPSVMSSRCMIRVSDVSSPGFNGTSEIFHIKEPRLTRFAADSTYEFFVPSLHGWSFSNSTSNMWPQSWWQQYDYLSGTDPYTGQEYPSFDTAYPFGFMAQSTYPSWPIFVETFSQDQCYSSTPMGLMYLMRSVNRWADIGHVFGGSCAGLCSSALLAFGSKSELDTRWGYLGLPNNSYQAVMTDDLREFINVLQIYVYGKERESWMAAHYQASVDVTVESIRRMLLASSSNIDAILFIADQTATSAHAVFPWAVVDDPDPNKVRINVYDPNLPGNDNMFIEVDTVANTWSYSDKPTWGGPHYFFLEYPVLWNLDTPELVALSRLHGALVTEKDSLTGIELQYPSDGYLTIYDAAGDSIGINATGGFSSMESASPLPPMFGPGDAPYGFLLPEQLYTIKLSGLADSTVRVGFYYDSLYIGYSRVGVDSSHTDSLLLDATLAVHNPDGDPRVVQLRMVQTLSGGERAIVIDSLQIASGGSLKLEPIDTSGWYLENPGEANTYRLWLRQISAEGEWKFRAHDVPVAAGVAHMATPDWSNLSDDSCVIYIDSNGDYVPDDSLMVYADILVGVEDDLDEVLPYRFELSQNYPNPFNPVTTIEYGLPRRSHVSIEIYNVLGQRVRTLIDREESAGSYTIPWDGTSSSGETVSTGVYFYRFQADDHVATKKMLLLK